MPYKVGDNIAMRSTIQSVENLTHLFDFEDMVNFEKEILSRNKEFKELLSFLNLGLYRLCQHKIDKKMADTILKYFIRSMIRLTLYGLFSGISDCSFAEKTELQRKSMSKNLKSCKVDYEWFYARLEIIEQDKSILRKTKFKFNDQCYICGERAVNPYLSNYGKRATNNKNDAKEDTSRIKYSDKVELVRKLAKDWIKYEELVKAIQNTNSKISNEVIFTFIDQLIKNEFLVSELRIPLTNKDPLNEVIQRLEKNGIKSEEVLLFQKLKNINQRREKYCSANIGDGINCYLDLCKDDEFDLDIKVGSELDDGATPASSGMSTFGTVCITITLSIDFCQDFSNTLDCFSERGDCSGGVWSMCN